ncbi:MAG: T9SS type A sorting domain-containing protein [candidate division Zixibacteria bacterium]|nr:T9SS type A sorting domain-containing protein [candidate division Zixibacteria bacterium]
MRSILLKAILIIALASPATAQIDTLMLVEIDNIDVPENISEIYIEDLTDSTRAIFIVTNNHIYAHDSQSYALFWTSRELDEPQNLRFADINSDGYTDLSVEDNLNIYLFDAIHDQTIWTSPVLDITYKCYGLGDRNYDGLPDIVTADHWHSDTTLDLDTVYVKAYENPAFDLEDETFFYVPWYDSSEGMQTWGIHESPYQVIIGDITHQNQLQSYIFIFTSYVSYGYEPTAGGSDGGGFLHQLDAGTLDSINTVETGLPLFHDFYIVSDSTYFFTLNQKLYSGTNSEGVYKYTNAISGELAISNEIFEHTYTTPEWDWGDNWRGCLIDDLDVSNPGYELCYVYRQNLKFNNADPFVETWSDYNDELMRYLRGSHFSVSLGFGISLLCELREVYYHLPQLMGYYLYDADTGDLVAFVNEFNIELSDIFISDLDANNIEEILSIDGNTLRIYHLDYATDIDNPTTLPHHTFLKPNYPNPFNAATTIDYGLSQPGHVTIDIYDLLGRHIETLIDTEHPHGLHQTTWHAENIPSGVYFYKINAGDYTKTRKMTLLK